MIAAIITTIATAGTLLGAIAIVAVYRCRSRFAGECESEQRWANHYFSKLIEARAKGYLPDDFDF
jgi:hypothetical protein